MSDPPAQGPGMLLFLGIMGERLPSVKGQVMKQLRIILSAAHRLPGDNPIGLAYDEANGYTGRDCHQVC